MDENQNQVEIQNPQIVENQTEIQDQNTNQQEFTGSNLKTSFIRTALMTLALVLYVVGFISAVSNKILGIVILLVAIGIIGHSAYQSSKDTSALKWVNVVFKILLLLAGIILIIFISMA